MRPLSPSEIELIARELSPRDELLLRIGCATGFRISEILTLRVRDLFIGREPRRELIIQRACLKNGRGAYRKKIKSRRVVLGEGVRKRLTEYMAFRFGFVDPSPDQILFSSRFSGRALGRKSYWKIVRRAAIRVGIEGGRIGTHSMRKTFAAAVYAATGHDLLATQKLLGHQSPLTTASYLEVDEERLDQVVLSLGGQTIKTYDDLHAAQALQ